MHNELKIRQIPLGKLKPYHNNAKIHTEKQIKQIIHSIKEFGFNDPIACDEKGIIIEGHGRYEAAKKLGMKTIPTIVLKGLSEVQKKAYILTHNKLTMNTGLDLEILTEELSDISNSDLDMSIFNFDIDINMDEILNNTEREIDMPEEFEEYKPNNKSGSDIIIHCENKKQLRNILNKLERTNWNYEVK